MVRDEGDASASIIAARVSRAIAAICGAARIRTGRTRLASAPSFQPPTGSQPSSQAEDELGERRQHEIGRHEAEARRRR